MKSDYVYCPGGEKSQSGVAAREKYSGIEVRSSGESIKDIKPKLDSIAGPHVVPIWNSHQGSIKTAEFIWDLIEEAKLKIYDIWAKRIEFWHVKRKSSENQFGVLGSVTVAQTQCSRYLLGSGKEFKGFTLTTEAFDKYQGGDKLDGVLIAPQSDLDDEFEVVSRDTANPNNFTTFVNFTANSELICDQAVCLTAVMIRPLNVGLGDDEQTLFESLFTYVDHVDEIPRLTFVVNRTERVGLLFEGKKLIAGDLLDAEQRDRDEIKVFEVAGSLERKYTSQLNEFFNETFPVLNGSDFILHEGQETCLFACPDLGIYTHGYDKSIVEPVIRFYISQFFKAIDDNIPCTAKQKALYDKHYSAWKAQQSNFIDFVRVS